MQTGTIIGNRRLQADYYQVRFHAPDMAAAAQPGQFVHVRIGDLEAHILRRPFSINDVDDTTVTVTYKIVGAGTAALAKMEAGAHCALLGPLGRGFTLPAADETPVMVAGGYGAAALYLIARRAADKGFLLMGARTAADLILVDDYAALGCGVMLATDDGSRGHAGRVTELLGALPVGKKYRLYGCGPGPMLAALGKLVGDDAELSVDHRMCCGVGACFACVVKLKDGAGGFRYARSCAEGPVFKAGELYWE